jgi:predicted nucleotidyltransferase
MYALLTQKQTEVADLCRSAGARRLDVFGSAVRADFDPAHSDLDFLVEFDDVAPAAYAQAFFSLKSGLEALFHRPVDLLTPSSLANPFFRQRVTAERQTLYAS